MTIEPHYHSNDVDKVTETTETPLTAIPRKKETARAWLLTLVLHFIIAGGLVSYWYYYQRPKQPTTMAIEIPKKQMPVPVETGNASAIATLSTITTVGSQPKLASGAKMSAAMASSTKPLASYIAKQNTPNPNITLPQNKITAVPITTVEQKIITHEAPIKKALTDRDLPQSERSNNANNEASTANTAKKQPITASSTNEKATTSKTPTQTKKVTVVKSKPTGDSASEKEANNLSKDIDADTERLSNLIDEVRNKNQKKIEAHSKLTIESESDDKEQPSKDGAE